MNNDKLIKAAKEIFRLRAIQAARTESFQQLAKDARAGMDAGEKQKRVRRLDSLGVVDFSTAIDDLCDAIKD